MHIKKAAEDFSAVFFIRSQCLQWISLPQKAFRFTVIICEKRMESIEPVR